MKSSKNDTNYNHNLDDLMLKILSNKNECYENELFKEIQKNGFTGSKKTFILHLAKMREENFIQYVKKGRKHVYSLTEDTKIRLDFDIKQYVKPKRRNLRQNATVSKYDKRKLYALILFQSGAGSGQIIPQSTKNNKHEESLMMIDPRYPGNRKVFINMNDFQKLPGVTQEDIIFRRNVAYKSIFSHIEFSETDIINTLKKIKDLGIEERIIQLSPRQGLQGLKQKEEKELAIEIIDDYLLKFIRSLEAILDAVEYSIRFSWIFNQQEPRRNSYEFQWYKDLFGTPRTVDVLIKSSHFKDFIKTVSEERREKLENQARTILLNADMAIVGLYYTFIKCSKLDMKFIRNRSEINNLIEYKEYIKKMPTKVFELLSILINICYPKFLKNKHSKDTIIRRYIHGLERLNTSSLNLK